MDPKKNTTDRKALRNRDTVVFDSRHHGTARRVNGTDGKPTYAQDRRIATNFIEKHKHDAKPGEK